MKVFRTSELVPTRIPDQHSGESFFIKKKLLLPRQLWGVEEASILLDPSGGGSLRFADLHGVP